MARLTTQARAELAESPWLEPFIEPDDMDLRPARERYGRAMAECRAEVYASGQTLYHRQRTADGHETTALQTHPAAGGTR